MNEKQASAALLLIISIVWVSGYICGILVSR